MGKKRRRKVEAEVAKRVYEKGERVLREVREEYGRAPLGWVVGGEYG